MRRSLFVCSCGLVLLLFSAGLLLVRCEAGQRQVPPDATSVRIYRHGLSEIHINYRSPASWTLSDVYQYHAAQGWIRDGLIERSLQRPWADSPTTVLAIFTRHRLFGLISEIAIIGAPANTHAGVQVRQVRCTTFEPWIRCL